jgi:hypothetical protein
VSIRSIAVKGQKGAIRVGARQAAGLSGFALTPVRKAVEGLEDQVVPNTWILTAAMVDRDAFLLSQVGAAYVVDLEVGRLGVWRWRGVELEIDGDNVRGTLAGRPEVR